MGYWKGTSNFSQACENLAMLLAESANIRCGDTILGNYFILFVFEFLNFEFYYYYLKTH